MNVTPGAQYASRVALGLAQTGLVGTIRFQLLDNDTTADDPVYGPSTASIIEDPTGSGVYQFLGSAPSTAGVYSPAWDLGPGTELILTESLIVTSTAATPQVPSGQDYITIEELKATLEMTGLTFADVDMASSISAASRAVDDITGRRFYLDLASSTRTYVPKWSRVD